MTRPSGPKIPASRSAAARAPARSPTSSRRPISPLRPPDRATTRSWSASRSAWRKRGHGLRPGQVGPRQQAGQAAPADLVAGEQDEPRPAGAGTDAAQVLLDRVAMPGQPGTVRAWPGGSAVIDDGERRLAGRSVRRPVGRRRGRRGGTTTAIRVRRRPDRPARSRPR